MKPFLTTTALFEGATGLALAISPSMVATLLLGTSLTDISAILIARLAGAALITIAIACWLFSSQPQSAPMVKAMLVYNVLSILLLGYALFIAKIAGPGLWPAALLHAGLLVWSILLLRKQVV